MAKSGSYWTDQFNLPAEFAADIDPSLLRIEAETRALDNAVLDSVGGRLRRLAVATGNHDSQMVDCVKRRMAILRNRMTRHDNAVMRPMVDQLDALISADQDVPVTVEETTDAASTPTALPPTTVPAEESTALESVSQVNGAVNGQAGDFAGGAETAVEGRVLGRPDVIANGIAPPLPGPIPRVWYVVCRGCRFNFATGASEAVCMGPFVTLPNALPTSGPCAIGEVLYHGPDIRAAQAAIARCRIEPVDCSPGGQPPPEPPPPEPPPPEPPPPEPACCPERVPMGLKCPKTWDDYLVRAAASSCNSTCEDKPVVLVTASLADMIERCGAPEKPAESEPEEEVEEVYFTPTGECFA